MTAAIKNIYFFVTGTYDYKFPVEEADSESLFEYCDPPPSNGVDPELETEMQRLMHLNGKHMPGTSEEGIDLLTWLVSVI